MNHRVPHWSIVDESRSFPDNSIASDQKKFKGPDHELAELLWHNGQVVLNSQTHRKPISISHESNPVHKADQPLKGSMSFGNLSGLIQEEETASWFQYAVDNSLEEFLPDLSHEIPTFDSIRSEKRSKETTSGTKSAKFATSEEAHVFVSSCNEKSQPTVKQSDNQHFARSTMPPPKLQTVDSTVSSNLDHGKVVNFSHFSMPVNGNLRSSREVIVSSYCGSNQVRNEPNLSQVSSNAVSPMKTFTGNIKEDAKKISLQNERRQTETLEMTVTSSSGASGETERIAKQTTSNQNHKRKERNADESECQSEDASVEANKPAQRSSSTRRSRAAEVHNLSERRRRDRINEKMRALQELIPNCNKSDKASMLDEAIEYLKSLQLQLQIMWMGSGMTPMMYPSLQHYLPGMGMGTSHSPLPSIHGPMQFPGVPLINHPIPPLLSNQKPICPSPVLNQVNLQNQVQNASMPESYAHYHGIQPLQTAPQTSNFFTYGSEIMQHNPTMAVLNNTRTSSLSTSTCAPCNTVLTNNIQNGNLG